MLVPAVLSKADGAYLYDVDGKVYRLCRFTGANGTGHNHPAIRNAVIEAAERGFKLRRANRDGSENGGTGHQLVPTMDMCAW